MKNEKLMKILIAVIAAAIVIAVVFAVLNNQKSNGNTTATQSQITSSATTESTAASTEEGQTSSESTEESTTAPEPAFLKKGNWYLFDKENTACYVFSFDGKGNVDLAMFDSSNIEDGDPQYFKGFAAYKADENKVEIEKLPSAMKLKGLTFEIKNGSLVYKGKKLDNHKNISVDYAFEYFGTV